MDATNAVIFVCVTVLLVCVFVILSKCARYCTGDPSDYREEITCNADFVEETL